MNLSKIFIERPVMTTLLMVAMIIFGIFGYVSLPVSDLPSFDFPTISVGASLPGADPETMASAVAAPLENQFSTINGVDSMTSSSGQGNTQITLQFNLDRNIDAAAQDVQTAISAATRQLPRAMPQPPTFRKQNPADLPILFIALSSTTLSPSKLDEYTETLLARQLSTIEGVAQVQVAGSTKYAVRIQADPAALASRQIGIDTLAAAITSANVNQATGALNGSTRSAIIHTQGQLDDADAFRHQVVTYRNGAPVRIGDVANVIDSIENPYSNSWLTGGKSAIALYISRQPGSNTIKTIDSIKAVLPQFQQSLPPSVKLEILYDRSISIKAAIDDVQLTLLIAGILVVGVIFVFLRRVSATAIPSLALPIAVIGTFAGMSAMGFSLDNLSLMALTLSVGFVVDDAIVMLENIVRHIEAGMKPYEAALQGASEIGFTILSMTISLAAVFIPIVFMGGVVGRLLHEFAVTIIIAIMASGVISVTLTPMLCARILRDEHGEKHNAFYNASEAAFNAVQNFYKRTLQWSITHPRFILGLFFASIVASLGLFSIMQQDFLPSDDTGRLGGQIQAANGTSFQQMSGYVRQAQRIIDADPNIATTLAQVDGGNGAAGTNSARVTIFLKPLSERALSADAIIRELRPKLNRIAGINTFLTNPPPVRLGGRGSRSNYQYTLQGLDLDELGTVSANLVRVLQENPDFVDVNSDRDAVMPSVQVEIDRDRAAAMGVTTQQIETALGSAFSSGQVSQINRSSNQYVVILELLPQYQRDPSALSHLYITASNVPGNPTNTTAGTVAVASPSSVGGAAVTGNGGVSNLVPLSAVTKITSSSMPLSVNHSGQVPAVTISFDMAAGKTLSDAVSGIAKATQEINMPETIVGSFQGTAAAFESSTQGMGLLLLVAMVVVYIILGILYESFIHPLTILSGLPSAALGALLTLYIFGVPITLYAFVGMIMLIGIVKKNAIMMIDFALHRMRDADVPPAEAIYEAAIIRFRPIMMTTMAAMMGTMPIALGMGAGAESRRPLGLCVAGGLLLSQLLTLYITPIIFVYLDRLGGHFQLFRRRPKIAPQAAPAE